MNNKRANSGITAVLYEENAYAKECEAQVLECRESVSEDGKTPLYGIVLSATVFFPEGGGQPADEGWLINLSEENSTHAKIKVLDVQKEDGVILHYVNQPLAAGSNVKAVLDWDLRYERMQNHSGEHLFCGLIHKLYGYENVGFHMSGECVTVDVNGALGAEDFEKLEQLANEGIYANADIKAVYPDTPEELDYRSKLELTEDIRVVVIDGYDACACCAPHVHSTGEIGLIKVIDFMSHRGGTRFTLKSGRWARQDYAVLQKEISSIMRLFSAKREECHLAAERVSEQMKSQQETILTLKKQITALHGVRLEEMIRSNPGATAVLFFDEAMDEAQLRALVNDGVTMAAGLIAGFVGKEGEGYRYIIGKNESAEEPDLRVLAKEMNEALQGRGGGSVKMIQGSLAASRGEIEEYFKKYQS